MRTVQVTNYEDVNEFMNSLADNEKVIFYSVENMMAFPYIASKKELIESAERVPDDAKAGFENMKVENLTAYIFE